MTDYSLFALIDAGFYGFGPSDDEIPTFDGDGLVGEYYQSAVDAIEAADEAACRSFDPDSAPPSGLGHYAIIQAPDGSTYRVRTMDGKRAVYSQSNGYHIWQPDYENQLELK